MEKTKIRIYEFDYLKTVESVGNSISSELGKISFKSRYDMDISLIENYNKILTFAFNKEFHEYCSDSGISSKEEKQKLLDYTLYYYISNDKFDEKESEIEYLISMLGADIGRKNEETNLSPLDYVSNLKIEDKKKKIQSALITYNTNLEVNKEMIKRPVSFFKSQDLNSICYRFFSEEEQQDASRNSNKNKIVENLDDCIMLMSSNNQNLNSDVAFFSEEKKQGAEKK